MGFIARTFQLDLCDLFCDCLQVFNLIVDCGGVFHSEAFYSKKTEAFKNNPDNLGLDADSTGSI